MSSSPNPYLQAHRVELPIDLYELIIESVKNKDETIPAFIRQVMATDFELDGPSKKPQDSD